MIIAILRSGQRIYVDSVDDLTEVPRMLVIRKSGAAKIGQSIL